MKLKAFIHDLRVNAVVDQIIALVYSIEFQKHVLPHTHNIVLISVDDKRRTPDDVDRFDSAEILVQQTHPELYREVR